MPCHPMVMTTMRVILDTVAGAPAYGTRVIRFGLGPIGDCRPTTLRLSH